ncbi:hypothetical protein L596_008452 [Steinernema carpocapsae]|uniref:Uncharacterized protein n=1 Tax=Steinernema carpocapsae TaxID=34508 RepID=A0A4U5PD17_STECR|nr:hypothetical protein L596_008452 [Steinernema carpocapsae]
MPFSTRHFISRNRKRCSKRRRNAMKSKRTEAVEKVEAPTGRQLALKQNECLEEPWKQTAPLFEAEEVGVIGCGLLTRHQRERCQGLCEITKVSPYLATFWPQFCQFLSGWLGGP